MSKSKENEIAKEISSKTITLKDRFAIAKLISNAPKSRVLMVAKIFEPELGVDITPFYDERCLQDSVLLNQNEAIETLLDFIDSYDDSVIKTFKDGARAINNKRFKQYLAERKMNYCNITRLLAETGVIRRDVDGRRSFNVYYNGKNTRSIIVNPDIVIKEHSDERS